MILHGGGLMINNPESREVRIKFLKELLINLK
jgi:hypothetical protein